MIPKKSCKTSIIEINYDVTRFLAREQARPSAPLPEIISVIEFVHQPDAQLLSINKYDELCCERYSADLVITLHFSHDFVSSGEAYGIELTN